MTTAYFMPIILLQSRLFEDVVERTTGNIQTRFSRHCYGSVLSGVTKLTMTAFHTDLSPTIFS
jgi:hypothetical protein